MDRRVAYAVGAAALPVVLVHHAGRRAAAYLFDDVVARGRVVLLVALAGAAVGAVVAWRARPRPPWRAPQLLVALAWTVVVAEITGFATFASAGAFRVVLHAGAACTGLLTGALVTTLVPSLAALAWSRAALLDALHIRGLAVVVALGAAMVVLAERGGALRVAIALSILTLLTAHVGTSALAPHAPASKRTRTVAAWSSYVLAALLVLVEPLTPIFEAPRLPDQVVYGRNGEACRVSLTSGRGAFQVYLDGVLRLSTIDAHRKREVMAHPAMTSATSRARVLVIGGGDGTTVREVLRYGDVARVTVVEQEPAWLAVGRTQPVLVHENAGALDDPRVTVIAADPLPWLRDGEGSFDVVLLDVADPDTPARAKLFTAYFYRLVARRLAKGGVGAAILPSPTGARRAFSCAIKTLASTGMSVLPYRANLPTMGVVGYALFADHPLTPPTRAPGGLAYLDDAGLADLFRLTPDERPVEDQVEANLLHHQVLVRYREDP